MINACMTLAIVITSTGACPDAEICWADVNGDCIVNNTDRNLVLAAYGPCGGDSLLSEENLKNWLDVGGNEKLDGGGITADEIGKAMEEPTEAERLVALYLLIVK